MLRVAIIGLGYFSQFHLAAWHRIKGATPVLGIDPNPDRFTNLTLPCSVTLAALADAKPDIVDIVAPPPAHAELIRASLAPGRIIICQKPFCTSLDEAKGILAEAEATGARVVIHENFRFQPWYRDLRAFLAQGDMGTVWQARFALRPGDGRGPRAYLDRQPAFQTMPRLLMHETGVHFLDLFQWLFGPATSIWADLRQLNPALAGEDAGLAVLTHATGVRSVFDGNRLADHVADNPRHTMGEMMVEGEGGQLTLTGDGRWHFRPFGQSTTQPIPQPHAVDPDSFGGGCVQALCQHVVDHLHHGTPLENEGHAYLPVMALCDAAYRSANQGETVRIS